MLRHRGDDFGMAEQNLAHLRRRRLAGDERSDGRRHGRANPQIAFFQRGQKLAAELRQQQAEAGEANAAPLATMVLR